MTKPRIHVLALGGTIATRPDSSGAMQMGLGADDLVAAVPLLKTVAEVEAETVSRVGSHSLGLDLIHELAAKIRGLKADGVVVNEKRFASLAFMGPNVGSADADRFFKSLKLS